MTIFDRIKDTSTTSGTALGATATFTVSGTAPSGYQTFSARYSVNDGDIPVVISHQSANEWQVCWCTYTTTNTLRVDTVIFSSNGDAGVNFSAGTKDVFVSASSRAFGGIRETNVWTGNNTFPNTGLKVLDTNASHVLTIAPGSNITADRTLTLTTGDASRTVTLNGDTTLTGTNTGDQTITLTGDVTGTGTGSFAATIANNAVTLAKMATVATDSILGRATASTGNVEVLTALPFAFTGDVTRPADSNAQTIANSAVTLAKMADVATSSVFYRKTAGTGAPEVQALSTLKTDLGLTGTNSGDQTITLTGDVTGAGTGTFAATIANNAVTLAKMATVATDSILGRASAATGNVEVLTSLPFAYTGDVTRAADSNATVLAAGNAGNLNSGTLLAARMPALTGDVTTTAGAVATTIANSAVTLAKMANLAQNRIIGRVTASTGVPEALTPENLITIFNAASTGTVNVARGGTGAATLTGIVKGNGTSAFTAGTVSLTSEVSGTLPAGNGGTGIASLGTGIATWLGTPSSANLATAVSDETGSGALVFASSPTLSTPTINGGSIQSRPQASSETTGTLTSASSNKTIQATGSITINNSVFSAGDIIVIYAGASSRTLTQGTGVTMRLAGTATTGSRTLAARSIATLFFVSASEVAVGGTGVT